MAPDVFGMVLTQLPKAASPAASFFNFLPQLAPIAAPSLFDVLFRFATIIGWRDQGQCTIYTNQDHRLDFNGQSLVPVHLAPALEDIVRAMDNRLPLESIPLANKGIDNIHFNGRVVLDVLDRLR